MQPAAAIKKEVVFFIDKQRFEVEDREYTIRELLEDFAKENADETVLVLRQGDDLVKLTDPDQRMRIKCASVFVVFHCGPTPVS